MQQQPTAPVQQGAGEAVPESEDQKAQRMAIVETFAGVVKDKRKAAIEGRRQSGIEEIWAEDEEHYEGVDDANRATVKMLKGTSMSDGLREQKADTSATRSTVFLKITRPYVDAAPARVSDMLLPTDDRNFALRPSPVPELTAMLKDERPAGADGQPMAARCSPARAPPHRRQGWAPGSRAPSASAWAARRPVPPAAGAHRRPGCAGGDRQGQGVRGARARADRRLADRCALPRRSAAGDRGLGQGGLRHPEGPGALA
jgi:hypothetical protein